MTDAAIPISSATGAPAAFLRGVERRAVVLAELQCGSMARGDAAVAAALRAFARTAPEAPMATWPVRFWSLLLAAPDLRRSAEGAAWPPAWAALAALGNGPRVALLLRLVAALEMDEAAAALGIAPEAYRAALQRAIPYRHDGTPDRDAWQDRVAQVRAAIEGMDPARLARLHAAPVARVADAQASTQGARQTSLQEPAPVAAQRAVQTPVAAPRAMRHRSWVVIATLAITCAGTAIGIAALHPHWFERLPFRGSLVRTAPLPPADAPASTYDADLAAWSHRDFIAIADPEGVRRADTLPFFAWYAASLSVQAAPEAMAVAATRAAPVPAAVLAEPAPAFVAPPRTQPLAVSRAITVPDAMLRQIARIPAPLQPDLQDQARLWTAWSPAQRARFAAHARQWDAQPRGVQARLRERYAAWRALDVIALDAVENAVQAFAHLPAQDQAAVRAQFDALEPLAQRGWLLGPALGAEYPKLQPLLAQLPEAQHAPMLHALRRMGAAERADLAVLAQRVPPQDRAELVRTLLSTADAQRAAWLQVRLAQ